MYNTLCIGSSYTISGNLEDEAIYTFKVPINRACKTEEEFKKSIRTTYNEYSKNKVEISEFDPDGFNTIFTYHGDKELIKLDHENEEKGLEELNKHAKFTLNFIDIIQHIEVKISDATSKYSVSGIDSPFYWTKSLYNKKI